MSRVSKKIDNCVASLTLSLAEKQKMYRDAGESVVSFGTGEPDFTTPAYICDGGKAAIDKGLTKYDAVSGMADLRKAILKKLREENHLHYGMDEIIVNAGAKSSLSLALQAIINAGEGDEIIIPKPYWVSYTEMVKLAGGIPVIVETDPKDSYIMHPDQFEAAITPRTKALLLNSPVNPTGAFYDEKTLAAIADIVVKHDILVISDEIYEEFMWEGNQSVSIASLGEAIKNNTIVVGGFSKTFAMTGWRLGYAAGPKDIIDGMNKIQGHTISHPCTIAQYAGQIALEQKGEAVQNIIKIFDKRRQAMLARLNRIPELSYIYPRAAFYIFVDISAIIADNRKGILSAFDFSEKLLEEKKVVTIPGEAFGVENYVRFSYATSLEEIEEGFDRIEDFLK